MNRAHCVIVGAASWFAGHTGALIIGLAVVWMASAPSAAWGQSAWPSYPNNTAISVSGSNVGIGTPSPSAPLSIVSTAQGSQIVLKDSTYGTGMSLTSYWPTITFNGYQSGLTTYATGSGYVGLLNMNPSTGDFTFITANNPGAGNQISMVALPITIKQSGNVGIGTTNPQYLLSVKGTVGAEEVIVTNTGWSDYVFQPGYRLRPLTEVGAYIQANHHLPDIPSEAEVKEKGVSVGEMQSKLLAKVEELTLHMIRQEKENQDLRERLARLENGAASGATPTAAK
jgi:hypothetical protein